MDGLEIGRNLTKMQTCDVRVYGQSDAFDRIFDRNEGAPSHAGKSLGRIPAGEFMALVKVGFKRTRISMADDIIREMLPVSGSHPNTAAMRRGTYESPPGRMTTDVMRKVAASNSCAYAGFWDRARMPTIAP